VRVGDDDHMSVARAGLYAASTCNYLANYSRSNGSGQWV
jgi:hypothetical protein